MEHSYLYIALAAALLVIAGLICALLYYRHRLYHCQQAMVRCINENLDMKAKLPSDEQPHFFTSQEITPKEFTKIICNMLKRLMYVSVISLLVLCPAMAQEGADTAEYTLSLRANLLRWGIDGVRVRGGKESKNWWGPVNAGVTLVWKLIK